VSYSHEDHGQDPNLQTRSCSRCDLELPSSVRICPNDGTDMLLSDSQLFADRYEFIEELGSGANGVIYKARHVTLDKIVAIKLLHDFSGEPSILLRFQREARAASSLSHPNVITIFDFGIHNDSQPYMVMDYLEGETLSEILKSGAALDTGGILDIMEPVGSALAHAHRKGILHRDLKPSNIMIVRDGYDRSQVKLLDFGLAKILDVEDPVKLSASGVAMGSPAYMSPEQATAHGVDHRSDLYAMGCIIYEMIAGDPPLLGDSPTETLIKRLNGIVPALRESTDRPVDPDMEAIVTRLLEREQSDRYQSAEEVLTALAAVRKRIERQKQEREQGVRTPRKELQSDPSQRDTVKDIRLNEFTEGRVMVFDPPLRRLVLQSAGAGEHFEPVIIPEGWLAELRTMPLPLKVVVILLMVMSGLLTLRSMIY